MKVVSMLVGVTLLTTACASLAPFGKQRSEAATGPADRRPLSPQEAADSLRSADALVTDGCLECLLEAHDIFTRIDGTRVGGKRIDGTRIGDDGLAAQPDLAARAARGVIETALLIAAREHELGLDDSNRLSQARSQLPNLSAANRDVFAFAIEMLDALPGGAPAGVVSAERDLLRRGAFLRRRDEFRAWLESRADDSPLLAYMWLSLNCAARAAGPAGPVGTGSPGSPGSSVNNDSLESLLQRVPRWRASTLLEYRAATCRATSVPQLTALLEAHPRFIELRYFIGRQALQDALPDEAIDAWRSAWDWRPRWPALTLALADAYLGIDEWDLALEFYERALAVTVDEPAALLGKARALTYLARNEDALVVLDRLLALNGWYPGDARYWRALNETQLERYEAAWDDIERAAALIVGADVSKLAGIIAHRLGRSEVARSKFEEAWRRNGLDCEVGVHLSIVQSGLRAWGGALEALGRTATCLESAEKQLNAEIERLRDTASEATAEATAEASAAAIAATSAASAAAARQAREVAVREERIATGRRLLATVWFNSAVASYYSARMDDARMFAERVVADDEFGAPARTLLSRIP